MFTGIIEALGTVVSVEKENQNLNFWIESPISDMLKIDQSVAHNGVCLTVVELKSQQHKVTAIEETLRKTHLGQLQTGDIINLERAMKIDDRLDGHLVQGHIDQTARCIAIKPQGGSHLFTFHHEAKEHITIEKGSVTVNGVSLTVVHSQEEEFSVAVIPYTFKHTNLKHIRVGSLVNIEFDLVGKYITKLYKIQNFPKIK